LTQQKTALHRRVFQILLRRPKKRAIRYGLLAANVMLLLAIIGFVVKSPGGSTPSQSSVFINPRSETVTNPLDQLSSADIAVHVAIATNLDQKVSVVNLADTINAQLAIVPADDTVVSKPQVVTTALKSKQDIQEYTTKEGDTLSAIARRFGVSSDSVRWSNGLTSEALPVGKKLYLPPRGVDGIVYTVRRGDTPASLARTYRSNEEAIRVFNDAEIDGLKAGERIVIPDGSPAPVVNTFSTYSFSPVYGYNGYDYGWCTHWAALRRAQVGKPVPSNLGNACTWASRARAAGIPTGSQPALHAVIMTKTYCWGHVGFVERLNPDGSIWVSDMNSSGHISMDTNSPRKSCGGGCWNQVTYRLEHPGEFGRYEFIY
jgi:surface antigen